MAAQIGCDHPVASGQMRDLRCPLFEVAGTAVNADNSTLSLAFERPNIDDA